MEQLVFVSSPRTNCSFLTLGFDFPFFSFSPFCSTSPPPSPALPHSPPGLFSWGVSLFSAPSQDKTTPPGGETPTRRTAATSTSDGSVMAETTRSWTTPAPPAPENNSSWVRVEAEVTTSPSDRRGEAVTSRAAPRGGRGRGKKNRGEDRGRGEEDGSGEVGGAEAKGEIQVSRRPVGTSKPRERSRERSRERGHRRGQSTTTTSSTPPGSPEATGTPAAGWETSTTPAESQSLSPSVPADPQTSPSASPPPGTASEPPPRSPSPSQSLPPSPPPPQTPPASHFPFQAAGSGDPAPSSHPDNGGSTVHPHTSPPWVPVEPAVLNVSAGVSEEDDSPWSHAIGSGSPLPGNMEEEGSRGGVNVSAVTVTVPAGESCMSRF